MPALAQEQVQQTRATGLQRPPEHTHNTHTHSHFNPILLCFNPAVLSMASHPPEQHVHHCVCALILSSGHSSYMSQAANHSINPGFITVIVMSRPPALSFQDVKEHGERLLLIQLSDQIFFKSKFLLHLLRRCSSPRLRQGA